MLLWIIRNFYGVFAYNFFVGMLADIGPDALYFDNQYIAICGRFVEIYYWQGENSLIPYISSSRSIDQGAVSGPVLLPAYFLPEYPCRIFHTGDTWAFGIVLRCSVVGGGALFGGIGQA